MKRIPLFRQALAALATCGLLLVSTGALAQASVILSDPNCVDFTLGGTAPNRTLTCVQSTTPLCTISGPAAGTIGSPVQLNTTTCVPAATSYMWAGGNCNGTATKNCTDPGTGYANNTVVNYTVTGTNGAGAGPASNTVTVTWTNSAPQAPSGCSLTPGSSNQSAGYQATFTVNCSGGGQPTSWAWSGPGTAGCNTANTAACGPITFNSTGTINVTPSNAAGPGNQASSKITIGGSGGGGGGGGGQLDCTSALQAHGLANPGPTVTIDIPWPNDTLNHFYYTSDAGGFFGNEALVFRFTTSAATSASGRGYIVGVEYGTSPSVRRGAINTTPCDFDSGIPLFNCAGQTTAFDTINPQIYLWQGGSNRSCAVTLQPNTTYYFNMYNAPGAPCTSQQSCDMRFTFQKPAGT